jgi:hypothetical protein
MEKTMALINKIGDTEQHAANASFMVEAQNDSIKITLEMTEIPPFVIKALIEYAEGNMAKDLIQTIIVNSGGETALKYVGKYAEGVN